MADSDDEYDRKRRDKFRGERSSGDSYRSDRRDERRAGGGSGAGGREDWADRNPFRGGGGARARPDYRDYRGPRDRYGSPGREMPPTKRMRPDWGDELRGNPRYGAYESYLMHAWNDHYAAHSLHSGFSHAHPAPHPREQPVANDVQTQPAMLTLKQFLDTQDDGISDSEVLTKYSEYKLDFKRQQLNEFFVAHKDEEWFKNKYHPVDSVKRKEEQLSFLQKRVDVFNELLVGGAIKNVSIDTSQQDPLLRLLDTVVIKLEGGTDDDLKILDEKPKDTIYPDRIIEKKLEHDDDVIITSVEKTKKQDEEPKIVSPRPIRRMAASASDDEENWDDDNDDGKPARRSDDDDDDDEDDDDAKSKNNDKKKDIKPERKRKRSNSDSSSSSSSDSDSSSSSSSDDDDDDDKFNDKYDLAKVKQEEVESDKEKAKEKVKVEEEPKKTAVVEEEKKNDDSFEQQSDNKKSSENGLDDKEEDSSFDNSLEKTKEDDEAHTVEPAASPAVSPAASPASGAASPASGAASPASAAASPASAAASPAAIEKSVVEDTDDVHMKEPMGTPEQVTDKNESDDVPISNAADQSEQQTENEAKLAVVVEAASESTKPTDTVDDTQPETIDLEKEKDLPRPRALHRTSSIFLRNLAPSITKAEIESICQRFDGFLRVAIADPLVERRWYRRGWVTFKRDVNIKEYCWNLNNTRLRDCEMGAIVNRDLSRRVRPVNGMTAHKTIVRADIKLCAKITLNLDDKFKLWENNKADSAEKANGNRESTASASNNYGFKSNNPVLQNITDYLIEEASAEEDELLGLTGNENKESDGSETVERDPQLLTALDCLILYLRIVHSVDFYNHCEYPYEDEMPNRCGIIHARGPAPTKVTQNDMQDYIKTFEGKMQTFLAKTTQVDEDELKNLGCKDAEVEVEKFVQANTQELAKDKWLCPLSGKKFKGPEFIRKHIFNKHVEKVDEVRKEVEFFNNYLRDPKRPQLPEHPGTTKRTNSESGGGPSYRAPAYPVYPPYAAYAPPLMMPGRGARGFGGRRPGGEYRQLIQYRDLDAPQDPVDMFN